MPLPQPISCGSISQGMPDLSAARGLEDAGLHVLRRLGQAL